MSDMTLNDLLARLESAEANIARLVAQVESASTAREHADVDASPIGLGERIPPTGSGASVAATPMEAPASRRALLRSGAVALGAAVAGLTARPAEAADGDPIVIGRMNTSTGETILVCNSNFGPMAAIQGYMTGATAYTRGVSGYTASPNGIGVLGYGFNGGSGVHGQTNSPNGIGVSGFQETGTAVLGQVYRGGNGVMGQVPDYSQANANAVFGLNISSYAGPWSGAGGFGVYGYSAKGHGVVGASGTARAAGVVGATNGVPGTFAAAFFGPVVVGGDFTVVGGAKSAAVPHPDGSHRRLYCVESPESWFEDFGQGALACGRADVPIDPDFAAVADMEGYQVFLTGYDHDHLLHVTNRTPSGFTVQANLALAALQRKEAQELSGQFGWRVVARRRDITGARLEPVTLPSAPTLPAPTITPTSPVDPKVRR